MGAAHSQTIPLAIPVCQLQGALAAAPGVGPPPCVCVSCARQHHNASVCVCVQMSEAKAMHARAEQMGLDVSISVRPPSGAPACQAPALCAHLLLHTSPAFEPAPGVWLTSRLAVSCPPGASRALVCALQMAELRRREQQLKDQEVRRCTSRGGPCGPLLGGMPCR